jgi:hypothetical protein
MTETETETETEINVDTERDDTYPCRVTIKYNGTETRRAVFTQHVDGVTDVSLIEGRVFNIEYADGLRLLVPVQRVENLTLAPNRTRRYP